MDFKIEIRRAIEEEKRKKKEIEKMIKKEGLESVGGGERKEKLRERGQESFLAATYRVYLEKK